MALTALAIKSAKSRAKPYKLADSDGLYLLVTPRGGRCWRMNYRHLGKQKTLAFGIWTPASPMPASAATRRASCWRGATIRPSRSSWNASRQPWRRPTASRLSPMNG